MIRTQAVALLLAIVSLGGCADEQRGADTAVDPASANPAPETVAGATTGKEWACPPREVYGFMTDPVVYPPDLSLNEVLSQLEPDPAAETSEVDSNTGRSASVTFRNDEGLIIRRVEFERSESVGWHIERGRAC
jgi:hypothetical protein